MQCGRDKKFPDAEEGKDEGDYYPDSRKTGEGNENEGKDDCRCHLLAQAVVIDHVDKDGIVIQVPLDQHPGQIATLEDLVIGQGAGEHVHSFHHQPLVAAREDFHCAALIPLTKEPGLDNVAIICFQYTCFGTLCIHIDGTGKASRDEDEHKRNKSQNNCKGDFASFLEFFHSCPLKTQRRLPLPKGASIHKSGLFYLTPHRAKSLWATSVLS